jgi:hypothetical protein
MDGRLDWGGRVDVEAGYLGRQRWGRLVMEMRLGRAKNVGSKSNPRYELILFLIGHNRLYRL